jgi:uncharacterized membrane protein YfcA
MDETLTQSLLFLIALVANTFSALAGGGSGLIQFPALIFLGLSFSLALATHKVASVALGIGATLRHLREDALERDFALYILACGVPGVVLGSVLAISIPARAGEIALGVLTFSLGLYSMFSPTLGQSVQPQVRTAGRLALGGAGLFAIGVLNGALTSGTGLFVTMLLVRLFGLDYKRAVAYTLVLVGLFWNGSGAVTLSWLAEVKWSWIPALLAGSLLGGYLGAHLAIVKGNRLIKRSYELVSILIGIKLLMP